MTKDQESNEPVDKASDDEYMDTGVLHEPKKTAGKGVRGTHAHLVEIDEVQDFKGKA